MSFSPQCAVNILVYESANHLVEIVSVYNSIVPNDQDEALTFHVSLN